ncbi:hypothetical protein DPMN_055491 [Dreissena polymorpha]|uniref:CXXC-type domain-containing protein n=1 Tax=Dreissena polymorpha TaxID=45954 RepID=A0A9D4HSM5_DREPO|nr:hypothetical protein DPMN_055491 [Dreissena polymorpha]
MAALLKRSSNNPVKKKKPKGTDGLKWLYDSKRKRKERCNDCTGCKAPDCGECIHCKDKPKFGGRGVRKQCCE